MLFWKSGLRMCSLVSSISLTKKENSMLLKIVFVNLEWITVLLHLIGLLIWLTSLIGFFFADLYILLRKAGICMLSKLFLLLSNFFFLSPIFGVATIDLYSNSFLFGSDIQNKEVRRHYLNVQICQFCFARLM